MDMISRLFSLCISTMILTLAYVCVSINPASVFLVHYYPFYFGGLFYFCLFAGPSYSY